MRCRAFGRSMLTMGTVTRSGLLRAGGRGAASAAISALRAARALPPPVRARGAAPGPRPRRPKRAPLVCEEDTCGHTGGCPRLRLLRRPRLLLRGRQRRTGAQGLLGGRRLASTALGLAIRMGGGQARLRAPAA